MIAITPRGERWYTPESEREEDNPTRFKLRDLTHGDRVRIFDSLRVFIDEDSGSVTTSAGSRTALACAKGLIDVENLVDSGGGYIPFGANKDGSPTDDFLAMIPWIVLREISDELLAESMTGEDVEKSEPSPEA